jgi:hypothetical protein
MVEIGADSLEHSHKMLMYADFGLKCCILVASRVTKTTGISGFSLGLLDCSLIVEVESTCKI